MTEFNIDCEKTDEEILTGEVSDEALEAAAGMSASAQAGSSLYSTITVAGCGC